MHISSLNIGKIQRYDWRKGADSAIIKSPVATEVMLTEIGLEGDEQADLKNHGGVDKAVMIIPESNYALFKVAQPFGFLGENITLAGIDEREVRLGDQFQIGEVLLEVSQPRSPCWKLGQINGSQMFVKQYSDSGRVGFYCRVLRTGCLKQGEAVLRAKTDSTLPTIQQLFLSKHQAPKNDQAWSIIETAIAYPGLSKAWRGELQRMLNRKP